MLETPLPQETVAKNKKAQSANEAVALTRRVKAAFRGLGYPQLDRIECQLTDGTMLLQGRLESFYLKQMAQAVAQRVPGIHRVVNEITVKSKLARSA